MRRTAAAAAAPYSSGGGGVRTRYCNPNRNRQSPEPDCKAFTSVLRDSLEQPVSSRGIAFQQRLSRAPRAVPTCRLSGGEAGSGPGSAGRCGRGPPPPPPLSPSSCACRRRRRSRCRRSRARAARCPRPETCLCRSTWTGCWEVGGGGRLAGLGGEVAAPAAPLRGWPESQRMRHVALPPHAPTLNPAQSTTAIIVSPRHSRRGRGLRGACMRVGRRLCRWQAAPRPCPNRPPAVLPDLERLASLLHRAKHHAAVAAGRDRVPAAVHGEARPGGRAARAASLPPLMSRACRAGRPACAGLGRRLSMLRRHLAAQHLHQARLGCIHVALGSSGAGALATGACQDRAARPPACCPSVPLQERLPLPAGQGDRLQDLHAAVRWLPAWAWAGSD